MHIFVVIYCLIVQILILFIIFIINDEKKYLFIIFEYFL